MNTAIVTILLALVPRWGIFVDNIACVDADSERHIVHENYEVVQCTYPDGVVLLLTHMEGEEPQCVQFGNDDVDYCKLRYEE